MSIQRPTDILVFVPEFAVKKPFPDITATAATSGMSAKFSERHPFHRRQEGRMPQAMRLHGAKTAVRVP